MSALKKAVNFPAQKAIKGEYKRFTSKETRVTPYSIPFVSASSYYGDLDTKGRRPHSFSISSGKVLKIPLRLPNDAIFNMIDIKYIAYPQLLEDPRWTGYNNAGADYSSFLGLVDLTPGSNVISSVLGGYNWDRKIQNQQFGVVVTINDALGNWIGTQQVYLNNVTANAAEMQVFQNGTLVNWNYTGALAYQGDVGTPAWTLTSQEPLANHWLKAAVYAVSPSAIALYGNNADVPATNDEIGKLTHFPHIERLFVGSFQGARDGRNQMRCEYQFPLDGTILLEIENIHPTDTLKVNGVISGYKVFAGGK